MPKQKRLIALSLYPRASESAGSGGEDSSAPSVLTESSSWARRAEGVSIELAAKALADSVEDFPGDVDLAAVTAEYYRKYQNVLNSENLDAAKFADGVMEKLLQEGSKDPDVLVRVYLYRTRYKLLDANTFLGRALQQAPDNYQALMLSTAEAVRKAKAPREALEAARVNLQKSD